jgi:hypothetical protein
MKAILDVRAKAYRVVRRVVQSLASSKLMESRFSMLCQLNPGIQFQNVSPASWLASISPENA